MEQPPVKEKDFFWVYIAALIVIVLVGVYIFKAREMQSVPYEAYQETKSQVEKQIQNPTKP